MSKPELSKQLIAQTLKRLMKNTPLDKISIQDIVRECGLNRKTFYYHFQDKQALISWIFETEFGSLKDLNQDNTIIDELIEHLYENKDFYVAVFKSDIQNNLREHIFKIAYNSFTSKVLAMIGNRRMEPEDIEMISNYFSNAVLGSITQWAREGMKTPLDEYIHNFYRITDECLTFIIDKYAKKHN